MKREFFLPALLVGTALVSLAAQAAITINLKSTAVELPKNEQALPDGPGLLVVRNNCVGCHSPGMILAQPTMPKAAWEAEVNKMRNVYKAQVAEKDIPTIVDYLTAIKGSK
jgi:cytochrome c5